MTAGEHTLVWFRQDLRIEDNPALAEAGRLGRPVIPVYIHSPEEEGGWAPGGASNWWLYHALADLEKQLKTSGLNLVIATGSSQQILQSLIDKYPVNTVLWNRRYEPAIIQRDAAISQHLIKQGLTVRSFNASVLYEPDQVANRSGNPFRVFTPFWKHLRSLPVPGPVDVRAGELNGAETKSPGVSLDDLGLLPDISWDREFPEHWQPDRQGAGAALQQFVRQGIDRYRDQRDLPGVDGTSRLSPYLHFGQLGPRQVWQAVQQSGAADGPGGYTFLSELGWREFACHLLVHFPNTPEQALNSGYRNFPWQPDRKYFRAWQRGMTGYPIVDAGMRQLWRTGWMHNRVRMIVASFLVKHLQQPWQDGARWFWDTLVDADLASNTMGWQWTAGCGADAAPYFRIFNPMLQGAKFDPDGVYVSTYVPELKRLPAKYIHQPWEAPEHVLKEAGIGLGENYPEPVIGHREGRSRALAALSENKQRNRSADSGN